MSRRIYDDEYRNDKLVKEFSDDVSSWVNQVFSRCPSAFYLSSYRENIGVKPVKDSIVRYLKNKENIVISDIVHHAHNIGNNNAFEVFEYDKEKNEQICLCYLNLVDDMYGGVYISVLNYPDKERTQKKHYHLHSSGARACY